MKKSPCYNCTRENKKIGCHSNCMAYQDYKLYLEMINNNRKEYQTSIDNGMSKNIGSLNKPLKRYYNNKKTSNRGQI